MTVPPE
jgi:ribosome biogenesis protein SSF1/2